MYPLFTAVKDIQQVYDDWLSTTNQNRPSDAPSPSQPMEEKQITMPMDYAEVTVRLAVFITVVCVDTQLNVCVVCSSAGCLLLRSVR